MHNVGLNVVMGSLCWGTFTCLLPRQRLYELFEREPASVWLSVGVQRELGWTGEALSNVD